MRSYLIIAASIILTSCINISHNRVKEDNPKHKSSSKLISLSNSGTLCFIKKGSNLIYTRYYPLSKSCLSSSQYSWKLNGFDVNQNREKIKIDSYSLYRKSNSQMSTKDCAGAGVVAKNILIKNKNLDIYWGSVKLANSSTLVGKSCFKKSKDTVVKIDMK